MKVYAFTSFYVKDLGKKKKDEMCEVVSENNMRIP